MPRPLARRIRVDTGSHQLLGILPDTAASGLMSSGSSRSAMARAALSTRSIWAGKASRKKPETRKVTSTRGRSSTPAGMISNPVTRPSRCPMSAVRPSRPAPGRYRRPPSACWRCQPTAPWSGASRRSPEGSARPREKPISNQMPSGWCRNRARIDRVEVPAGRQNLRPSARRSAGWAGFDKAPVETAQKPGQFGVTAGGHHGPQMSGDVIQNGAGSRPFRSATTSPATSFRASSSRRSTVSPWVRQRRRFQRHRSRPRPGIAHDTVQRVELQPKVPRQGTDQRGVPALAPAARQPRQSHQKIGQQTPFRRHAEDVQPSRIWSSFNSHR